MVFNKHFYFKINLSMRMNIFIPKLIVTINDKTSSKMTQRNIK